MYDVIITRKNPFDRFYRTYETKAMAEAEKERLLTNKKYQETLLSVEIIPHKKDWLEEN